MTEMIARVARAICCPGGCLMQDSANCMWKDYTRHADAVFAALDDPTKAMVNAAPNLSEVDFYPTDVYRPMIAAARDVNRS